MTEKLCSKKNMDLYNALMIKFCNAHYIRKPVIDRSNIHAPIEDVRAQNLLTYRFLLNFDYNLIDFCY